MSALELRDVVVDYERRGGGRVRAVAGASLTVEPRADRRPRRRVGVRQVDARARRGRARGADRRHRARSKARAVTPLTRRARPRDLVRLQLVFQNPYSSLNPRRKVGAQLGDALAALDLVPRGRRAARVRELLELVGLPRDRGRPLPARVLRRPAPADRDRARARGGSLGDRARRAARVARRLGAGAAREPARRPLARARARAAADLARSRDRPPRRRRRLGDVPRADGRDRPDAAALAAAAPPVQRGADRRGSASRRSGFLPRPCRARCRIRRTRRAAAASIRAARTPSTGAAADEPPLVALPSGRTAACWLQPAGASRAARRRAIGSKTYDLRTAEPRRTWLRPIPCAARGLAAAARRPRSHLRARSQRTAATSARGRGADARRRQLVHDQDGGSAARVRSDRDRSSTGRSTTRCSPTRAATSRIRSRCSCSRGRRERMRRRSRSS